jgi:hypothetical protein
VANEDGDEFVSAVHGGGVSTRERSSCILA